MPSTRTLCVFVVFWENLLDFIGRISMHYPFQCRRALDAISIEIQFVCRVSTARFHRPADHYRLGAAHLINHYVIGMIGKMQNDVSPHGRPRIYCWPSPPQSQRDQRLTNGLSKYSGIRIFPPEFSGLTLGCVLF